MAEPSDPGKGKLPVEDSQDEVDWRARSWSYGPTRRPLWLAHKPTTAGIVLIMLGSGVLIAHVALLVHHLGDLAADLLFAPAGTGLVLGLGLVIAGLLCRERPYWPPLPQTSKPQAQEADTSVQ